MKRSNLFAVSMTLASASTVGAATLTENVPWPGPPTTVSGSGVTSLPFADFNPALGTLTSYTLAVAGSGTSTDALAPDLAFKGPGPGDDVCSYRAGGSPFTFNTSGSTAFSGDLVAVEGTGTAAFLLQDFSDGGGTSTAITFTSSTITYTYTAAVPEPASLGLLGVAGGAVALRRRRRCRG